MLKHKENINSNPNTSLILLRNISRMYKMCLTYVCHLLLLKVGKLKKTTKTKQICMQIYMAVYPTFLFTPQNKARACSIKDQSK